MTEVRPIENNEMAIYVRKDGVQVETKRNGVSSLKNTTIRAVQEVLTRGERIETPLLPSVWGVQKYVKVNNREMYVISTPPSVRKVKFDFRDDGNREMKEFTIPLPGFVWILIVEHNPANDTRRYIHGMAYAVKNQILSTNDQLYVFPFSNVDHHWMCWGDGRNYPELGTSKSVMTVPDRFLANPFNNHLDHGKYQEFRTEVKGQNIRLFKTSHLFEHLDKERTKSLEEGKGEIPFKYEVLRTQTRLGDAIDQYMREYLR